ncbi:hypothetical protein C9374_003548 [Naegleria lovaniensis]|uniref:Uncharacterized protein n=1 Tax=Naegleria lovaniensis TaxID=51637 RepID=A0AA88H5B6_NAELO|nr:uncharacterized protein C9374_003548 [Naegleria lovaniensis]KAG2393784.1 hypothetical protein C9374_003548 [Naegleria lovaniensis]
MRDFIAAKLLVSPAIRRKEGDLSLLPDCCTVHKVTPVPPESETEIEFYTAAKVTVLAPVDMYTIFNTSAILYSLAYDCSIDDNMLIRSLSNVLFYFPCIGAKFRELNTNNDQDMKMLTDQERDLIQNRRKKVAVLDHTNRFMNVIVCRKDSKTFLKNCISSHTMDIASIIDHPQFLDEFIVENEVAIPYSKKELSRIQITYLEDCNKMVISLSLNHSAGGAELGHYFLQCWSEMVRCGKISEKPTVSRLELILAKNKLDHIFQYTHPEVKSIFHEYVFNMAKTMLTCRFKVRKVVLGKEKIDSFKDQIRNKLGERAPKILSANDIICGILFKMMAHGNSNLSDDTILNLRIVSNYKYIYPPIMFDTLSKIFVGNSQMPIWIAKSKSELCKMSLEECIALVRSQVQEQYSETNVRKFIEETSKSYHDERRSDWYRPIMTNQRTTLSFSNWSIFKFLDIDFGQGKPSRLLNLKDIEAVHIAFCMQQTENTFTLSCGLTDEEWTYMSSLISLFLF